MTRMSSARGLTALAVLGIVALGGTSACASSATSPGGSGSGSGSPSPSLSVGPPSLLPLPSVGTPTASTPPTVPGTGRATATPSNIKPDSYTTSGTTLTVQFIGGVCVTYSLEADPATAGAVRVTILATPKSPAVRACPMLEKQQSVSTDLGSPLDGRTVVDTLTGQAVPQLTVSPSGGRVTHGPVKQ